MRRRRQRQRTPAPSTARHRWRLPLLLAAVFVVKLIVLVQLQDHPLLQPEGALDAAEYVRLAREVLAGNVLLGPGLYYLSPLYIYVLAAGLAVSDSYAFVRVVQIALGTAAVGCVFVAARVWFGTRAAWIAAALAALSGVFTFYEIVLFQSSIDAFLTSAALACLAIGLRDEARVRLKMGLAGLLFGLQILNRPNIAIAIAGVALTLAATRRWRAAAWLSAGVLFALTPVVARNALVSGQFALASSQGGLNFFIGNNAQATGQYAAVPGVRANIAGQAEDTRRVAEAAAGHPLSDAQVSAYFTGLATSWIREQPRAAARLFLRKLALTFNASHQWLDFSYPYYAYDTGSLLWILFVGPWLLVPLGLAGMVLRSRTALSPAPLRAFALCYALGLAIFFVGERYRLPLLVPLCIFAAAAIDSLLGGLTRRELAVPALVLVAAAILAGWRFHLPDGRFEERLRLSKALMNRRDYGAAATELERASALRPSDTATEFNLGMAQVSAGRADEGLAHVRHAVDGGVAIPGARYALASATLATGDRDAAVALLRGYYPDDEDTADSCYQVALLALDAGAPRVAERYLQRALQLRPRWPDALRVLQQIER
jgi:4-amino-4-deoxy-L-arabinose transferase-like glycosyltransferase